MADKPQLPAVAGTLTLRSSALHYCIGMVIVMRYLIGALSALVILVGAAPAPAAAATVSCGRVTTFVNPDSAGALNNGDGWLIFAKPDGTSDKVILRSGSMTSFGGIAGYICMGIDGVYFTGLLTPGAIGYIPEPANWVTGTGVYCGTVAVNPFTSGQISGPRTFQLRGGLSAYGYGIFRVPASIALPTIGSYVCGRFEIGGPSQLLTVVQADDPGYVAAGLPSTSTAPASSTSAGSLALALVVAGLALVARCARRTSSD